MPRICFEDLEPLLVLGFCFFIYLGRVSTVLTFNGANRCDFVRRTIVRVADELVWQIIFETGTQFLPIKMEAIGRTISWFCYSYNR